MKKFFPLIFLLTLFSFVPCWAAFEDHFKRCENKIAPPQIKGIDYVYVINLDRRSDRLQEGLKELSPYGIVPYRFSAIYGKNLSVKALNEVGLQYREGMGKGRWVECFPKDSTPEQAFLADACYGKTCFASCMRIGAIGCALSHLSVLQDAYDSGYETIWVMEDDLCVKESPHKISELIERLDSLCGKGGWDVLYTDMDMRYPSETELKYDMGWMWRPDEESSDLSRYAQRKKISEDFIKVGFRLGAQSLIVRRSGMKKILDYEKKKHLFLPYDLEIALPPTIQLYMLRYPIVTGREGTISDISR